MIIAARHFPSLIAENPLLPPEHADTVFLSSDKMKVAVQRRQHRIGAGRFIMGLQIFLKRYNCVFIPFFTHKHQKFSHIPAVFFDRMAAFFLFSQIIPKSFQFILCFLFQCVSSLSHETFSRICFFRSCFFFHNCDHFSIF